MTINITLPDGSIGSELKPRITVVGVGGAGGNAVNNMIQSGLEGVEFVAANSDAQALSLSKSEHRIQMGVNITQGLGAGANPDIGRAAAEESLDEIISHIKDTNMVFITAGLGGGTGTGAAPVIARAAREYGILTVGVVTKPFQFEGTNRMRMAESGLEEIQQYVDTLLIIPNQNLFRVANEKTTFADAFKMADDVLYSGVRGVTDLMVMPGLINLDFADIKSVMSEMGKAMMGTGEAEGERRATEAAERAIANPLLDDTSMGGAKGVLINITAGTDITLFEVDEAANRIRDEVDGDVNIIFGSTFDESLEGRVRVSVVATGIESESDKKIDPIIHQVNEPLSVSSSNNHTTQEIVENTNSNRHHSSLQDLDKVNKQNFQGSFNEIDKSGPVNDLDTVEKNSENSDQENPQIAEGIPEFLSKSRVDEDVFIPGETSNAKEAAISANPFAVADMINVSKESEKPAKSRKSSGLSLFERVTGVGRGDKKRPNEIKVEQSTDTTIIKDDTGESALPTHNEEQGESYAVTEVNSGEHTPSDNMNKGNLVDGETEMQDEIAHKEQNESSGTELDEIKNVASESPQQLLGDLDPEERLPEASKKDDVLDIPAFLRRQAN